MGLKIKYEANNSDFGRLMMSSQTQDLADDAANFGAQVARLYAAGSRPRPPADYIASIKAAPGPPVVLGTGGHANPRRTARVVADHRLGGVIEFGSGPTGPGGRERPQGGSSPAYRILGRTGARVGSPPRKAA